MMSGDKLIWLVAMNARGYVWELNWLGRCAQFTKGQRDGGLNNGFEG